MRKYVFLLFMSTLFAAPYHTYAQVTRLLELSQLPKKNKRSAVNRIVKKASDKNGSFLQVMEEKKEGIVWLPVKAFKNGTIEIKMRGKDVFQRSFIGIAFHALNDTVYDAVYCRPFNFFAQDPVRRIHAIQYISHPIFTWEKLRRERNGIFEKDILTPPDPNDWFIMKLVIDDMIVKAYINNAIHPALTIKKLSDSRSGKIGLFTADSSGGDFKTIQINYK